MNRFHLKKYLRKFFGILAPIALASNLVLFMQNCRVETVKSLYSEDRLSDRLFFDESDIFDTGEFASPEPLSTASFLGNQEEEIHFGSAFVDFKPTSKTSLAGFGGISRRLLPPQLTGADGFFTYCKPYESVDLNPRIKVMLWTQNQDVFAIIALDVVAVPADVSRKLVAALQDKFPQYKWTQGNVQIVASHTHSGPAGLTENPFWSVFACDRYSSPLWEFFEEKSLEAVRIALQKGSGSKSIQSIWTKKQNIEKLSKSRLPGMEVHKQSLVISMADGEAVTSGSPCLTTFAIHPTWYGAQSLVLSPDVVGHLEKKLAKSNKGTDCLFLNGAVGNADMDHAKDLDSYSTELANTLLNWKPEAWKKETLKLSFGAKLVTLPKPKPNLKACKVPPVDFLVGADVLENLPPRTKLSFLRLGSTLFLFYPGEPVFSLQKDIEAKIKAKMPDVQTVQILSLSNDYVGYMVDSPNFDNETLEACSTLYGSEISGVMSNAVLDLLKIR